MAGRAAERAAIAVEPPQSLSSVWQREYNGNRTEATGQLSLARYKLLHHVELVKKVQAEPEKAEKIDSARVRVLWNTYAWYKGKSDDVQERQDFATLGKDAYTEAVDELYGYLDELARAHLACIPKIKRGKYRILELDSEELDRQERARPRDAMYKASRDFIAAVEDQYPRPPKRDIAEPKD